MGKHTYPDHSLENAIRERGHLCQVMWELPGPKNTDVAWIVAYLINGCLVLVETFKSGGWNAFTSDRTNRVDDTIDDVLNRCDVPDKPAERERIEPAEIIADFHKRLTAMENSIWLNNYVQFPRLLAEIRAVSLTPEQYVALGESMDLSRDEIDELLERAEVIWNHAKLSA